MKKIQIQDCLCKVKFSRRASARLDVRAVQYKQRYKKRTRQSLLAAMMFAALVSVGTYSLADDCGKGKGRSDNGVVAPQIREVMKRSRYRFARWGLLVQDLESGRVLQHLNPDEFFLPASTTKMFTVAVAFDTFGADHRFVTPIRRNGGIDAQGLLSGDLILVAAGDLTLGGRDNPDGTIAFRNFDHVDANEIDGAELTAPDPLGGLDRLAEQVASAGITRVTGEVIIDDRLFETRETRPEVFVSPIVVNDNFIDVTIEATHEGQKAMVDWRPKSQAFSVDTDDVKTVAAGEKPEIVISGEVADGKLVVRGTIPEDYAGELVRVRRISTPAPFARTLLIEALKRAGVEVDAPLLGGNPANRLPSQKAVAELEQVAALVSAPLSEYGKLILKVSHNLGAEMMAAVIAANIGETGVDAGLRRIGEVLPSLGVEADTFAFASASGRDSNRTTPRAAVNLLRHFYGRADHKALFDALPMLGVDGSLVLVQPNSNAKGQVHAKTGTGVSGDIAHEQLFLTTKALAGYIESSKGRKLAFSLYVNNARLDEWEDPILGDVFEVNDDLGEIAAIIWARF